MKFNGDYPIYVNPEFDEICELAKSHPNTLRILDDEEYLVVASGYGNTHTTLQTLMRNLGFKRYHGTDYILYREGETWYWNPLGHWATHSEKVPLKSRYVCVTERLALFVKDFVNAE